MNENEKPTPHPSRRSGFSLSPFFQKIFFEKVSFPDSRSLSSVRHPFLKKNHRTMTIIDRTISKGIKSLTLYNKARHMSHKSSSLSSSSSSSCPNGDPSFTRLLLQAFGPWAASPEGRRTLYYSVCIPTRCLIFVLVAWFNGILTTLLRVGAAIAALQLTVSSYMNVQTQWWSKRYDAVVGLLVLFSPRLWVPYVFLLSILGGLAQSSWITFC